MREQLLKKTEQELKKNGFVVSSFQQYNSCFDIAARRKDLQLLVKVFENIDSFREEQAKELQKLGNVLNAVSLIIGEKSKVLRLKKGLIYERYSLPVMALETFSEMFFSSIPHIKYFKGKAIVELDSELLKKKREELGLSFRELADELGTTTESIYRYEHGFSASLEKAKELEKVFRISLIKETSLEMHVPEKVSAFEKKLKDSALNQLKHLGLKVAIFEHSPFRAFSEPKEPVIISKGIASKEIERKAGILEKTKAVFNTHSMIISKEFSRERIETTPIVLEEELKELQKAKELLKLLKEREKE